ncbi:MAG: transglutaminase domain-containing protein [Planctomycetes bacterium]|nr:transglutaminase domain-containing protein [Planctomycetota bacterium]
MRILYDKYSTRRRAEVLLLAGDSLWLVSAVLFATGICSIPGRALDAALIAVWVLIPRGMAHFFGWFDKPRDFLRSLFLSALLVIGVVFLTFIGWELIWETLPRHPTSRMETALLILLAWASGFLVFSPRTYRLIDFLAGSVALLGLLELKPLALLWLPLFLLGFCISASSRHLLHDVFTEVRHPRINLQNARALSFLSTVLAIGLFVPVSMGLRPLLDTGAARARGGPQARARIGYRGSFGNPWYQGAGSLFPRQVDGELGERPSAYAGQEAGGRRTIGYAQQISLSALATPRFDRRVVLKARIVDEQGRPAASAAREWEPSILLWKGMTFSRFDARTGSWVEATDYETIPWGETSTLRVDAPAGGGGVRIEVEVVTPVFRNLVAPYFTRELGPIHPSQPGGHVYRNDFGDLFPAAPPVQRGMRYFLRAAPSPSAYSPLPPGEAAGTHSDSRYLHVPPAADLGFDLVRLASDKKLRASSIQESVRRLRRYFSAELVYSISTTWGDGEHRLRDFLLTAKMGDCSYFSTAAALLLRAAGVSSRVAVGFLGSEVDAEGAAVVRNASAHAWVEIFVPQHGWYPVDATAWVELLESDAALLAREGPGLLSTGRAGPGGDAELEGDAAGDVEWSGSKKPAPETGSAGRYAESASPGEDEEEELAAAAEGSGSDQDAAWVTVRLPNEEKETGGEPGRRRPPPDGRRPAAFAFWRSEARGAVARYVLGALALAATALVLVSFLRPSPRKRRRRSSDAEEEETGADAEAELAGEEIDSADELSPADALLLEYHRLQRDLVKTRSHRLSHETPREHGRRFKHRAQDLDAALDGLVESVYGTLYGGAPAGEGDLRSARVRCRCVRRHLG